MFYRVSPKHKVAIVKVRLTTTLSLVVLLFSFTLFFFSKPLKLSTGQEMNAQGKEFCKIGGKSGNIILNQN